MLIIALICWTLSALGGIAYGLLIRKKEEGEWVPEKEEGAGVSYDSQTIDVLKEAFRAISPNSRGRGSMDLLNLSTLIQKMEAGEAVPDGLAYYLLSKIEGAGEYAEKLKTGAGA